MVQFKEKKNSSDKFSSLSLYSYPVLMAADILLYQAHLVPVGED
jgi:tryptophanyl-tRNA synthetase